VAASDPALAHDAAADAVGDGASRCAALARAGGATRRELSRAAGGLVGIRGWERLGFARLADYAVERLGVSGRELQDLARVDAALRSLPRVDAALAAGRISWTKARLLARIATAEDEGRWLGVAKALSARALSREVRRVDAGSLEAGALVAEMAEEEAGEGRRETLQLRCTPETKAKWHRARMLVCRVAGQRLGPWQCAEAVAAEVLSAVPLDAIDAPADDLAPVMADMRPGSPHPAAAASRLPRAERRARRARAGDEADGSDPFALDARPRELVAVEQRSEAELAEVLRAVAEEGLHRVRGFATLDSYARDELGISPRRARMLLRLARAANRVPELAWAWRTGWLSFLRAYTLVPVVLAAPAHARGWIARARRVTCRRLEEEVDRALLAADLDPAGFAGDGALPVGASRSPSVERQAGAQATATGETCRLMINGPSEVIRLLRATLCTVRRRMESRTERCPSQGEAFAAMLDAALAEWLARAKGRVRRAERVYARDGWRCTVPGCSSYRNLERHHVVFRSRGGSHALANRTTLCAWHHHRGVHAGRVRCTGNAPDGLRFELGLRPGRPPLLVYG